VLRFPGHRWIAGRKVAERQHHLAGKYRLAAPKTDGCHAANPTQRYSFVLQMLQLAGMKLDLLLKQGRDIPAIQPAWQEVTRLDIQMMSGPNPSQKVLGIVRKSTHILCWNVQQMLPAIGSVGNAAAEAIASFNEPNGDVPACPSQQLGRQRRAGKTAPNDCYRKVALCGVFVIPIHVWLLQ
jgi:hypothetical protein